MSARILRPEVLTWPGSELTGRRFHLAWHQSHVSPIVIGSLPLLYVLVPEGTDSKLSLIELEVIGDSGRPREKLHANQLQLASPRDPDLTLTGAESLFCEREKALISNLVGRAKAASYVLPEIIPTGAPPHGLDSRCPPTSAGSCGEPAALFR
jgi:hypothetical protein